VVQPYHLAVHLVALLHWESALADPVEHPLGIGIKYAHLPRKEIRLFSFVDRNIACSGCTAYLSVLRVAMY